MGIQFLWLYLYMVLVLITRGMLLEWYGVERATKAGFKLFPVSPNVNYALKLPICTNFYQAIAQLYYSPIILSHDAIV